MKTLLATHGARCAALGLVCWSASVAPAALTAVPAFTGTYSETFESFPPQTTQLFVPNPTPTFNGHATLTVSGSDGVNAIAIYTGPDGSSPYGDAQPSDGTQYAVTQNTGQTVSLAFDTAATEFGGYFGGDPLSFTFLDAQNNIVGTAAITPASVNGTLAFVGYQSSVNFQTVQITATTPTSITLDGLQVTVPEPASAAVLAVGGLALLRRRTRTAAI